MSMHSSIRLPRFANGTPINSKSSRHGLIPTPRTSRLSISHASEPACLATSAGGRIGSLTTNVVNRSVVVTIPSAAVSTNASMNALSSRNSRLPSGVYGYVESDSNGYAMLSGTVMLA